MRWIMSVALMSAVGSAWASDVEMAWQARVLDSSGAPINGPQAVLVTIDPATGPSFVEDLGTVVIQDGYLAALLGSTPGNPLDDATLTDTPVEVAVSIGGEELSRQLLTSVATRVTPAAVAAALAEASCGAGDNGILGFDDTTDRVRVCVDGSWKSIGTGGDGGDGTGATTPGRSCGEVVADLPSSGNGDYWLDPDGGAVDNAIKTYCDMDGGGWTFLETEYQSYSWQFNQCGGTNDSDCRPMSNSYSYIEYQDGVLGEVRYVDVFGVVVPDVQLTALANRTTQANIPIDSHSFDGQCGSSYEADFYYHNGTSTRVPNAAICHGSVDEAWGDTSARLQESYVENSAAILHYVDITLSNHWGVYLRFTADGIWVK